MYITLAIIKIVIREKLNDTKGITLDDNTVSSGFIPFNLFIHFFPLSTFKRMVKRQEYMDLLPPMNLEAINPI